MGMYTEFHFNVQLLSKVPNEVVDLLKFMVSTEETKYESRLKNLPSHPLFYTDRWVRMLLSDSYYFSADTHSTLRFDGITNGYYLCIRCNLKNYNNEIEKFVDWIDNYVQANSGDFLGFSRYEESENPKIIRKK
jgi:hypothetical protein